VNENDLVSVEWVVNKLGLSALPKKRAYEIIADYVTNGSFEMYFDELVVGTDAIEDVGMVCDGNGQFVGWSIENGYSSEHDGIKVAGGVNADHSGDRFNFAINDYYFNEERFYPTDSEGIWHRQKLVDVDLASFDKGQVDSLGSSNNFGKGKADQGLLKALALLAREMADNSDGFKTGNKVNANAFKDHVLFLAEHYEISDGYLRSLGDKVKKVLKDLDLNDTPPDKK
jgi:hypothetical protein